ncbi:uncharacterized protein LOC130979157 [Arachis stenosperma]|uniref:uncharacterized protein LOC130979157 n=1 Tax=Arachis stenosperma TaxID=217475 RepID=UPI0025AC4357|nr:uncharacterized protein LOC130979157 [Arachis stenosperma]
MEDLWKRAKIFAEEAAKKSQEIGAAVSSSATATTSSVRFADLVSETTKKSKELAAEASKRAEEIKAAIAAEAAKHADSIKTLSDGITIPPQISAAIATASSAAAAAAPSSSAPSLPNDDDLEKFGVTDDLRSFVRGLTSTTFQNFPLSFDEPQASDVPTVASNNVRKDLNDFQEKHATLVLITVKEISRLRYELCPRTMKERHFWKIYFTLVNTHVAPYEKKYMEEVQLRDAADKTVAKLEQATITGGSGNVEATGNNVKSKSSKTSSTEQDLDTFLLGDLEDSDEGPDGGADGFDDDDDDFDKIGNSDVEDEKHGKKTSAPEV